MAEKTNQPEQVGIVVVPIEDMGGRMIFRHQWADGTTADGRAFDVTFALSGLAMTVEIEGGLKYVIPLQVVVDTVLALDAKRGIAVCSKCGREFSRQESRAGFTTCEHCDLRALARAEGKGGGG